MAPSKMQQEYLSTETTFKQTNLMYLFPFLWHEILVLIFNMFIYLQTDTCLTAIKKIITTVFLFQLL